MTPAIRYVLTQLETAIACENLTLAEFYCEELRKELSATDARRELVPQLDHEAGREP